MKKLQVVLVIVLAALIAASCASTGTAAKPADTKPAIEKEKVQTVTATVQAVDLANRMVTLKGPKGNVFDLYVDETARNLDQVAVGDEVSVTFRAAMSVKVFAPGEAVPAEQDLTGTTKSELGQKPGGTAVRVKTVTATVEAIDPAFPAVMLLGPDAKYYTVVVQDPKNLEKIKVGDKLSITFSVAVALSVEKPVKK
jgi:Cu/Ag efflux protein CusF